MFGTSAFSEIPFSSSSKADVEVTATGVNASANLGSAVGANEEAWGISDWNEGGWGGVISTTASVTGVSSTVSLGSAQVFLGANVDVTGVAATTSIGNIVVSAGANHAVIGTAASGVIGSSSVTATANVTLTGLTATAGLGTSTTSISTDVVVSGVSASGSLGQVLALEPSSWGALTWGEPRGWSGLVYVDVSATGVSAATTLGNFNVSTDQNISVSGLEAVAGLGNATADISVEAPVTGVAATTTLGTVTTTADANAQPTGLQATTTLGDVEFKTTNYIPVNGVSATASLGTVTPKADANVTVIGVSAIVLTATPLIWQNIDDDQTPNWTDITTGSGNWTEVDDTQSPNWLPIAA